jgi:hypothetical protein
MEMEKIKLACIGNMMLKIRRSKRFGKTESKSKVDSSVTPLKMEPKQVTETSEVKTQTPGKFPEESTLESQHGESLKT